MNLKNITQLKTLLFFSVIVSFLWIPITFAQDKTAASCITRSEPFRSLGIGLGTRNSGCIDAVPYVVYLPKKWTVGGPLMMHMYGYWPETSKIDVLTIYDNVVRPWLKQGYAVAISKSTYGWVPYQRMEDTEKLRSFFIEEFGKGQNSYPSIITGFSMGGMQTFYLIENNPNYDGALPMCAFSQRSYDYLYQYVFNGRVLFDNFFPGILKGSAVNFPNGSKTQEKTCTRLRKHIPVGPNNYFCPPSKNPVYLLVPWQELSTGDLESYKQATSIPSSGMVPTMVALNSGLLWELNQRYKGNIFDNTNQVYFNGRYPERHVERYQATSKFDQEVVITGKIDKPVLGMHTTIDENIPVELTDHYQNLTYAQGTTENFVQLTVNRTGHCTFQWPEMGASLKQLNDWIVDNKRPVPGSITNGKIDPN